MPYMAGPPPRGLPGVRALFRHLYRGKDGRERPVAQAFRQKVFCLVRAVPAGRVTTYGAIAAAAGKLRGARQVGQVLSRGGEKGVPAHRVVNCKGELAPEEAFGRGFQRHLLTREGVGFTRAGKVDLKRYFYQPSLKD